MSPGKPVTQSLFSHPSHVHSPSPSWNGLTEGSSVLCVHWASGYQNGESRRQGRQGRRAPSTNRLRADGNGLCVSERRRGGVRGSRYPLQPEERSRKQANKTCPCNPDGAVQGPAEVVGIMRAHGAMCTALDSFQSTFAQTCSLQQTALLGSVCGDAGATLSTVQ